MSAVNVASTAVTEPSNAPIPPAERATDSCEGGPVPGREDTPEPSTTRGARLTAGAKVWWHREDPARPHLPGAALQSPRRSHAMQRILSTELARHVGRDRHGRRLGPPPPAAQVGGLPDRPGRRRAQPGRRHRPRGPGPARGAARGDASSRSTGTVTANPAGAGRGRADRPDRPGAGSAASVPLPFELHRPALTRDPAHPARPCRSGPAASDPRARPLRIAAAATAGFRAALERAAVRRDPHAEDRRVGHRVRRERLRARLLRPARPTWPSRRSSTSS